MAPAMLIATPCHARYYVIFATDTMLLITLYFHLFKYAAADIFMILRFHYFSPLFAFLSLMPPLPLAPLFSPILFC